MLAELKLDQTLISPRFRDQLIMAALLSQLSVFEYKNPVSGPHG